MHTHLIHMQYMHNTNCLCFCFSCPFAARWCIFNIFSNFPTPYTLLSHPKDNFLNACLRMLT